MTMQYSQVLEILKVNYAKALELIPPDMRDDFQRKILRLEELKEYSQSMAVAIQFRDELSMQKVENWMVEHFSRGGFGRKLMQKGIDPSRVYETLLKGIYDYK
jgi:hypothetical protein